MTEPQRLQVYAVCRYDTFISYPAEALTVKEVLPTPEEAEEEVDRLNRLAETRGIDAVYFWRATRYFPEGRSRTG